MIKITLPYPPSVNHYYVRNRFGGVAVGNEGRRYRTAVQLIAINRGVTMPMAGDLEMNIRMYPPDRIRRDTDNILKCLFDAMEKAGFYENDYCIRKHTVERMDVFKGGKVEVEIKGY